MSTLKVNTILSETPNVTITDGLNVTGVSTVTTLNTTNLVNATPLSNRNKVINGAMRISQRGASFSQTTSAEYTLDRFSHGVGSSFNFDTTITQDSTAPDGFLKSLKVVPDTTQTPSGSDNGTIQTKLEGQDLQDFAFGLSSAKSMTVSFYAKSGSQNNGHQYGLQLRTRDSSNAARYVSQAFTVTTSWQRYTMTFAGNTSVAMRNDNDDGLEIVFHLVSGPDDIVSAKSTWTTSNSYQTVTGQSNFMDNTSNEFYLTGVQLEVGSVATPFEHRSYDEQFKLCQRYYQDWQDYTHPATKGLDSNYDGHIIIDTLRINMRVNPTVTHTVYGRIADSGSWTDGSNGEAASLHNDPSSDYPGRYIKVTGAHNWDTNYNNTIAVKFVAATFDAEV
tara:strand:+ start:209 stop:1381 length:1173 start_codon:yes stop_codon:yes gene_type:complete